MDNRSLGGSLEPTLMHRIAVVVDKVHRAGNRQYVNQRWHRQNNRIDRLARRPYHPQRRSRAGDRAEENNPSQHDTPKRPPSQKQSENPRKASQANQCALPLLVDRYIIDRRTTKMEIRIGNPGSLDKPP